MIEADLVIRNIRQLATPAGVPPLRGSDFGKLLVIDDAAIAVRDERIVWVGAEADLVQAVAVNEETDTIDAAGTLAIPGLVDCHAHPVFAGDRSEEFDMRNTGVDYETLHARGGGIARTVRMTRAALTDSIAPDVSLHYDWMLRAGTTTTEAKSGYALTVDGELESLRTAIACAGMHPIDVVPTILAAHTIPIEYVERGDAYIDEIAIPAVKAAAEQGLARAADIFVERGSFNTVQARRYLTAAAEAGLLLRLHGDQFSEQGSLSLAIELDARSVDHLEATDQRGANRLADSDVAGVLLPLSSLFLGRPYAPGRALADACGIVAVASDFNPGSSYGESLTLAMSLACVGCGLRSSEALCAVTANAAWVLDLHDEVGRLEPGLLADVLLVDQPDVRHLAYHVGSPAVRAVIKRGCLVEL